MNPPLCISTSGSALARCHLPQINQHLQLLSTRMGHHKHFFQVERKTSRCTRLYAVTEVAFSSEDIIDTGTIEAIKGLQDLNEIHSRFPNTEESQILVDIQHPCLSAENICRQISFVSDTSSGDVIVPLNIITQSGDVRIPFNRIPGLPDKMQSGEIPIVESFKSVSTASIDAANSTFDSITTAKVAENILLQVEPNSVAEADKVLPKLQNVVESTLSIVYGATDRAFEALKGASDILDGTETAIISATNTLQETMFRFFTSVEESVQRLFTNDSSGLKNVYDSLNGSILSSLKLRSYFENGAEAADEQDGPFNFTSFLHIGTPANNLLKKMISIVRDSTGAVLETGGTVVSGFYNVAKGALPEEVQAYLNIGEKWVVKFTGPIGSGFKQAYAILIDAERALGVDPDNPAIPVILITSSTILVGITYWRTRYGGYAGDLSPRAAFNLLRKGSNVVLVDIRSKELKDTDGIPDLRRHARQKYVIVEILKVQDSLRRLLKNASQIDNMLTAAIIKSLKNVEAKTKVIIIDEDGSHSKEIARVLRKTGITSPYIVEGGFRSWKANGLRVKLIGQETVLSIIREETEAVFEEINPTADHFFLIAIGLIGGIYAIFELEKTLQLLGFIGLCQLIYTRFNSYKNADDLKADFRILMRPFSIMTQATLRISGLVEPTKLQLATSPSTSAVQDRVLQAAAKHGPSQSELDQQDEKLPSGTTVPENTSTSKEE